MQETRSITCAVSSEQKETALWQNFGWTLLSSQEVNKIDNHLEQDFAGNVYQVRNTEQYVKLVFSRDTKMPNYEEIVKLEREYDSLKFIPRKKEMKFRILLFLCFHIFYLPIYIVSTVIAKKANKEIDQQNKAIQEQIDSICVKARYLLDA